MTFRTLSAATALLAFMSVMPTQQAAAQLNTFGGAVVGGTVGAIIGGAATGRAGGAVIGAAIGATTGALIGSEADRRANGHYYWRDGCYRQDAYGNWYQVGRSYC